MAAKKNRIFSGQILTDQELTEIEKQLKKSRERDIAAQKKSNEKRKARNARISLKKAEKRLEKVRQHVGGATEGREAHERYKAIMDNIRKSDRALVRGMDYEDVFIAADALVKNATDYWTADDFENYIMDYLSAVIND